MTSDQPTVARAVCRSVHKSCHCLHLMVLLHCMWAFLFDDQYDFASLRVCRLSKLTSARAVRRSCHTLHLMVLSHCIWAFLFDASFLFSMIWHHYRVCRLSKLTSACEVCRCSQLNTIKHVLGPR